MIDKNKIDGLILSAGLSSRIGSQKALLMYNEFNFITNIILKLSAVCQNIIVVTGYQSEDVEKSFNNYLTAGKNKIASVFGFTHSEIDNLFERTFFIKNIQFEKGMFNSLQTGLSNLKNSEYVLYHFVDQPTLPVQFYKRIIMEINDCVDWIQPVYENKKGHPIIFSKNAASIILNSGTNNNLRDIKKIISNKKYWQCDYPEIFDDIDTISRYNNIIMNNKVYEQ
jgi:molybdenum cofactor cytidylyltransferase